MYSLLVIPGKVRVNISASVILSFTSSVFMVRGR